MTDVDFSLMGEEVTVQTTVEDRFDAARVAEAVVVSGTVIDEEHVQALSTEVLFELFAAVLVDVRDSIEGTALEEDT